MKARVSSIEKKPRVDVIMRNQKVNPNDTANALKRGEENSILNWIDKYH